MPGIAPPDTAHPTAASHGLVLEWYARSARELPWRPAGGAAAHPWGVLVSEVMLQQTPVDRVVPAWRAWLRRWPEPAALAADSPGEAVRAWGRLGYPRRALRLHAAAVVCVEQHGGAVPSDVDDLRALPGVGAYTAAAVAAFAFGQRHAVLDTNVRRVLARVLDGASGAPPSQTVVEVRRATALLPDEPHAAAAWSVAVMELGALVCTARRPRCADCPLAATCAWRLAGHPVDVGRDGAASRRSQPYAGTDRQVRGLLLDVLRQCASESGAGDAGSGLGAARTRQATAAAGDAAVPLSRLERVWGDAAQRDRALASLVADGLIEPLPGRRYRLPR